MDTTLFAAVSTLFHDEAVVAVDAAGRIFAFSVGAEQLTGRSAAEVCGTPVSTLLSEDDEALWLHRGDEQFPVERVSVPVPDGEFTLERWRPCSPTDAMAGAQSLRYAKDLARSHAAERQRAAALDRALGELREAHGQLQERHDALEDTRRALEARVDDQLKALERARTSATMRQHAGEPTRLHGLVTVAPRMRETLETVRHVAATDASVLITGESGTGKELVARALHTESRRARSGRFVAINCATLSPQLIESELFGHAKGAFTGADRAHEGVFAQASEGTLFLDEVGELPLAQQSKLLRVLQERMVRPVGGATERPVDVRVVCATHRSLEADVAAGRFREDLLYRLRVVPLTLPPLRERREDLPLLLKELLQRHAGDGPTPTLAPAAVRALLNYRWPGNVRELDNAIQYALAMTRDETIGVDALPPQLRHGSPPPPKAEEPPTDEAAAIRAALAQTGGRVGEAAALLGVSRATFHRRRKRLGL